MTENGKRFDPAEHIIQLKNKQGGSDYLPVQFRLVWFREAFPHGSIETELLHLDLERETEVEIFVWSQEKRRSEKQIKSARGVAIFRAIVRDGQGGIATGTKMEKASAFLDFLEKSETGAIGRALAALGYGTQFAPELDEQDRIVDAPVERSTSSAVPSTSRAADANRTSQKTTQKPQRTIEQRAMRCYELAAKYYLITGEGEKTREAFWQLVKRVCGIQLQAYNQFTSDTMRTLELHIKEEISKIS